MLNHKPSSLFNLMLHLESTVVTGITRSLCKDAAIKGSKNYTYCKNYIFIIFWQQNFYLIFTAMLICCQLPSLFFSFCSSEQILWGLTGKLFLLYWIQCSGGYTSGKPVTGLFLSVHAGTVPFLKIKIQLQIPLMRRCYPLCNLKIYEKLIVLTNF